MFEMFDAAYSAAGIGKSWYDSLGGLSGEDFLFLQLHNIQLELKNINQKISEVILEVNDMAIKTQYVSAQRVILEAIRCFENYAKMTKKEDKAYWLREFKKYGNLVRESISFLMDGMLGNGFIASDILQTICSMSQV